MIHAIGCHFKGQWGTLDSGIAVHSCTDIAMWISWTLGLQSIAQTSTNKQVFRMNQVHQFFNEPCSSRTTALYKAAKEKYYEHTKGQLCNLQFGPRHRKADHEIADLLERNIVFAIPMTFQFLGPNLSPVATSVQNTPPHERTGGLGGRLWGRGPGCTPLFWSSAFEVAGNSAIPHTPACARAAPYCAYLT